MVKGFRLTSLLQSRNKISCHRSQAELKQICYLEKLLLIWLDFKARCCGYNICWYSVDTSWSIWMQLWYLKTLMLLLGSNQLATNMSKYQLKSLKAVRNKWELQLRSRVEKKLLSLYFVLNIKSYSMLIKSGKLDLFYFNFHKTSSTNRVPVITSNATSSNVISLKG